MPEISIYSSLCKFTLTLNKYLILSYVINLKILYYLLRC